VSLWPGSVTWTQPPQFARQRCAGSKGLLEVRIDGAPVSAMNPPKALPREEAQDRTGCGVAEEGLQGLAVEPGEERSDPSPTAEKEIRVLHILRLTERIDGLRKYTGGRGVWRYVLPLWAVLAIGANGFLGLPWDFLVKLGLGMGFVVGYVELIMWWYSKKIDAWEQEIEDTRQNSPDPEDQRAPHVLDPGAHG
jgi:hypothetical protein